MLETLGTSLLDALAYSVKSMTNYDWFKNISVIPFGFPSQKAGSRRRGGGGKGAGGRDELDH